MAAEMGGKLRTRAKEVSKILFNGVGSDHFVWIRVVLWAHAELRSKRQVRLLCTCDPLATQPRSHACGLTAVITACGQIASECARDQDGPLATQPRSYGRGLTAGMRACGQIASKYARDQAGDSG